ncbi:hypothetical protein [Mesorhizobium sp. Cs1321R2N1]|uniref:hypothetical protein n=1 Tax=Mesorhizobium sp. Cs1321R2N1 TaxID=3015174 RepID=UPI00301E56CB
MSEAQLARQHDAQPSIDNQDRCAAMGCSFACTEQTTAGALAAIALAASVYQREDASIPLVALIFVAAFGTLAISFWPYMIPFSITIEQAAAPHSSVAFMFWERALRVPAHAALHGDRPNHVQGQVGSHIQNDAWPSVESPKRDTDDFISIVACCICRRRIRPNHSGQDWARRRNTDKARKHHLGNSDS